MALYKNKKIQIVVTILALLFFLNPSLTKFMEFGQEASNNRNAVVFKRTFNGLIFSIYQKQMFSNDPGGHWEPQPDGEPEKYIGFCMNFFKIKNDETESNSNSHENNSSADSTKNNLGSVDAPAWAKEMPKKQLTKSPETVSGEGDVPDWAKSMAAQKKPDTTKPNFNLPAMGTDTSLKK